MERIDINGLIEELQRVDKMFDTVKTDEERVFLFVRLTNSGQTLMQMAGAQANGLTTKCVERLNPKVIS